MYKLAYSPSAASCMASFCRFLNVPVINKAKFFAVLLFLPNFVTSCAVRLVRDAPSEGWRWGWKE